MSDSSEKLDAVYEQMLHLPNSVEARAWLKGLGDVQRTLSGGDGSKSAIEGDAALRFVENLYALGAVKVTASDIEGYLEHYDYEDTDTLIVELPGNQSPEDRLKRSQLFQWYAEFALSKHWDPVEDEGEKYMFVWWS